MRDGSGLNVFAVRGYEFRGHLSFDVPSPSGRGLGEGFSARLKQKLLFPSFAPHPGPLPKGEGDQNNLSPGHSLALPLTPALSQREREIRTTYRLVIR